MSRTHRSGTDVECEEENPEECEDEILDPLPALASLQLARDIFLAWERVDNCMAQAAQWTHALAAAQCVLKAADTGMDPRVAAAH